MRDENDFNAEEMLDDLNILLEDADETRDAQNDESVSCPDEDEIDEYYDPGDEVGSYFEEHGVEPPDDIDMLNTETDTAEASNIENHGGDGESLEEEEDRNVVESEDIIEDFDIDEEEDDDDRPGALKYYTGSPELIEVRCAEYHHSGFRCLLATVLLGISLDAPVLSDLSGWMNVIKDRLDYYFREVYKPHLSDPNLFLLPKYLPYDAAEEACKIESGKPSDKEIAKYLMNHKGPIVIDIDSVYENFRSRSWMIKFWVVDIQNYKLLSGGKL